jgi:pimeloyl-ACP methyl ester carboxylesterase
MKHSLRILCLLSCFLNVLISCTVQPLEQPIAANSSATTLVSSQLVRNYEQNQIFVADSAKSFVRGGISGYRIVYRTRDAFGASVQASGAVFLPRNADGSRPNETLPLVSYHHGTLFPSQNGDSPSFFTNYFEWDIPKTLAASGYVLAVPDYVGFGESSNTPHAYSHVRSTVAASLDMMRATRELCTQLGVRLSGKVFLAGWSQGGAVTSGAARQIEDSLSQEFQLTASAPLAGPYQYSVFADSVLSANRDLVFINTYVWVLLSYNRVYGINRPASYYLSQSAQAAAQNLEARIPLNPQQTFTQEFRTAYLNRSDQAMLRAFRDNDTDNWRPRAPFTFYHGTADDFVPLFNAQNALAKMRANGSTAVRLVPLQGADHSSGLDAYLVEMLREWSVLR